MPRSKPHRLFALLRAAPLLLVAAALGGCLSWQASPQKPKDPSAFVRAGEGQIYVEEAGKGEATVLLVHGFGATGRSWELVRPALARRFRVLTVDLPGHGRSDKLPGDYSPAALAQKLLAVLDARGVGPVLVVGHSFGTAVSLALAQAAPKRVRAVALIAPYVYEEQIPPFMIWSRAPLLGEALFALFWQQRMDARVAASFYEPGPWAHPDIVDRTRELLERPGALAAGLATVRGMRFAGMARRYPEMTTPALVISGREDPVSRLPFARRLSRDLRCPQVVIPLCGHVPLLERPAQVVNALLPFLAAHAPDSAAPDPAPGARAAPRPRASSRTGSCSCSCSCSKSSVAAGTRCVPCGDAPGPRTRLDKPAVAPSWIPTNSFPLPLPLPACTAGETGILAACRLSPDCRGERPVGVGHGHGHGHGHEAILLKLPQKRRSARRGQVARFVGVLEGATVRRSRAVRRTGRARARARVRTRGRGYLARTTAAAALAGGAS